MNPYYTDYGEYIKRFFPDFKVQKISVNTGSGCPNRDGTVGTGGCVYCNNSSFTPGYCFGADGVRGQLEAGKRFFGRKYPEMKYLAYFQAYSSTYGKSPEVLHKELTEATGVDGIVGFVIGTRPDCIGDDVLDVLSKFGSRLPVFVELGVESLHDNTLSLINRGHDSKTALDAIERTSERGLHVGAHLIAGLPGEDVPMMLDTVRRICCSRVETIKLHQLQILKGTTLAKLVETGSVRIKPFTLEEYLSFCEEVVRIVPKRIAIERFLSSAPPEMVIMPRWGVKNYIFTDKLLKKLSEKIEK